MIYCHGPGHLDEVTPIDLGRLFAVVVRPPTEAHDRIDQEAKYHYENVVRYDEYEMGQVQNGMSRRGSPTMQS